MHPTVLLTVIAVVVGVLCTVLITTLVWYKRSKKRQQENALPEVPEDEYVEERPNSDFTLPLATDKMPKNLAKWIKGLPSHLILERESAAGYTSLTVDPECFIDKIYENSADVLIKEHPMVNDVVNDVDFVVEDKSSAYQVRVYYHRPVGSKWPRCTPVPAEKPG